VTRGTLALVESATQLLNVAEWAYAGGETADLLIAVLAPGDKRTVQQINRVAELVRELDVPIRTHSVRTARPGTVAGIVSVTRALARAERLVIGDPFSRFIQTVLPVAAAADDVVVVDDGTATWEFVKCIDAGRPLVRWGVPLSGAEPRASRAGRLLSPSLTRALTVFSCLDDAIPLAATGLANRYEWARSAGRPVLVDDEIDVLGVSLVDNGIVQRRPYVDAVAGLARRHAPVRYIAHRRESESLVAEIAELPGVRVVRLDLPVELALRRGPVARRVITFPSTASHTLPVVLSDAGTRVEVRRIEPEWFTPETTKHAREFVTRIAARAPSRPMLEIA
jgi:hypothetical protein